MNQHTKRKLVAAMAAVLCMAMVPQVASAASYSVISNGVSVPNTLAEMTNGQLMVSVRPFAESLGYKVWWNATSKMVTISKPGYWLTMWIGNSLSFQNDKKVWAPVAPYLKDGVAMVPAYWLSVRLGAKVSYSNNTLTTSNGLAPVQTTSTNPNPRPDSPLADPTYVFPFAEGARYFAYTDTMGAYRSWDGQTFGHEGTDIPADKWTPVVAVASGTVVRYGWNTLGGYRLTIRLDDYPEYMFYYAHLSGYASGLYEGAHVNKGQVIGYVGSTGEGPEGTSGKFIDHLHFTIYDSDFDPINSYPFLKYWEGNKVKL